MLPQHEKLRVLVVDDNVDAATSLCALLRLLGCEADAAFGKAVALETAASFRPDVVVLDLEMPEADGCQVLQEMHDSGDGLADPLYVCLTGADSDENRRRCEAAGFDRFHGKPLRLPELNDILADGDATRLRRFAAIAAARATQANASGTSLAIKPDRA